MMLLKNKNWVDIVGSERKQCSGARGPGATESDQQWQRAVVNCDMVLDREKDSDAVVEKVAARVPVVADCQCRRAGSVPTPQIYYEELNFIHWPNSIFVHVYMF